MLGCVYSQCSYSLGRYLPFSVAGEDGLDFFEGQLYPVFSALLRKARLPVKINMGGPKGECFIRIQFDCLSHSKLKYKWYLVFTATTRKGLGGWCDNGGLEGQK